VKQLVCEMCGSKELVKQDGVFICQSCSTKYSVEEAKKMMVDVDTAIEQKNESTEMKSPSEIPKTSTKQSPLFTDLKPKKRDTGSGCVIFIIVVIVLAIIGAILPENNSTSASNIGDQKIKGRVQLEQAIKANLREPKSYQNITTDVWTLDEYIFVSNKFRGKNRYGGYEECTFVAQFNFNAKPTEWEITNKPSSNSGCRAIMTALP